ncbi:MAG TPA: glycosyltransferase family 2 protein [Gaiellaceae bacterium]|jgi:cellulose synthase/poly-beta-1,6-N-acetylglucosamine synthase-like glycosyltransferase
MSAVRDVLQWTVTVCVGYVVAVYGAYGVMIAYSMLEERLRRRRRTIESLDRVRASPLTIPVSIIAPVYNEAPVVAASTRSFLEIDYPEYEVIVVNDGSTDDTLSVLQNEFDLEPIEHFYRRRYESGPIRGLYRSRMHPNLIVIDKVNGGKADSLNCGLNLARYRYVCGVDGDTILSRSCLLNGMRLALVDPQRIVGVTGHIAISSRPEDALAKDGEPAKLDSRPLLVFQHCDYLRAFFNNRLGWTRLNTMLCAVGAFQIWRSDVIEEIGGFSTTFTCEDIELTFRVHEHFRRTGRPYEIVALADTVGVTEGPDTVRKLVAQRERWQRVILETVVSYRRMVFRRRYGTVGFIGVPFFVLSEVIAPVFELLALAALIASVALHTLEIEQALLTLVALALMNGLMTSAAVLLEDRTSRAYPLRDLVRLIVLGPLDLVIYRPFIVWARLKGTWRYLRGDQGWHKFERNARPAT